MCGGDLVDTMIRTMGAVSPHITWQMHSGKCEEHGWFQAEIVGRPPRDIFAVTRPFGTSRRLVINGREVYQFPTVWNDVDFDVRMDRMGKADRVDPLDARYWVARPIE